jgi:hypothetical protein
MEIKTPALCGRFFAMDGMYAGNAGAIAGVAAQQIPP